MTESFTKLKEITGYNVHYKPKDNIVAFKDCPKVIRDAANGHPPELFRESPLQVLRRSWALMLLCGIVFNTLWPFAWGFNPEIAHNPIALILVIFLPLVVLPFMVSKDSHDSYGQNKEIFDAFEANPDLYRDEIYKAAVERLSYVDFAGKHLPLNDGAKVGRFEAEVIEILRKMGIRQETTVANRGRPFLIHQYELTELKWGKWENGDSKNYVPDIAILWPERRIKFDIEVDDPSHKTGTRPLKDRDRDSVLTERGWFTRRLNHNFLSDSSKATEALKEIVGIVYFFAKYADQKPIDWDFRIWARMANRRFRSKTKKS